MQVERENLVLFVEKAEDMRASGLWQRYYGEGREICFSFGIDRSTQKLVDTQFAGPDADTLAALLLPLRMFIQLKDQVSFQQIRTLLRENPEVISSAARFEILSHLDESARGLRAPVVGGALVVGSIPEARKVRGSHVFTYEDVMKTFLYGHYAHVNKKRRAQYLAWKQSPRSAFFESVFVSVVSDLLCTTLNIADVLGPELAQ